VKHMLKICAFGEFLLEVLRFFVTDFECSDALRFVRKDSMGRDPPD
jgi:hypothetical protein